MMKISKEMELNTRPFKNKEPARNGKKTLNDFGQLSKLRGELILKEKAHKNEATETEYTDPVEYKLIQEQKKKNMGKAFDIFVDKFLKIAQEKEARREIKNNIIGKKEEIPKTTIETEEGGLVEKMPVITFFDGTTKKVNVGDEFFIGNIKYKIGKTRTAKNGKFLIHVISEDKGSAEELTPKEFERKFSKSDDISFPLSKDRQKEIIGKKRIEEKKKKSSVKNQEPKDQVLTEEVPEDVVLNNAEEEKDDLKIIGTVSPEFVSYVKNNPVILGENIPVETISENPKEIKEILSEMAETVKKNPVTFKTQEKDIDKQIDEAKERVGSHIDNIVNTEIIKNRKELEKLPNSKNTEEENEDALNKDRKEQNAIKDEIKKELDKKGKAEMFNSVSPAREEFFKALNVKKPELRKTWAFFGKNKEHEEELELYNQNIKEKENIYKTIRSEYMKELSLENGEAKEFLTKEVELRHKNNIENGPLSERIRTGINKGMERWDNFGNEKGWKGLAKRMSKVTISLALIGAISSFNIEQLAKHGIGTASALSGGMTSYLGRKMLFGLGFGTTMEAFKGLSPKQREIMQLIIIAGTTTIAVVTGTAIAGLAVGGASAAGYGLSKLVRGKFSEEKIQTKIETAKNTTEIDPNNLDKTTEKYENDLLEALKVAENTRFKRLLAGSFVAITSSTAILEVSGLVHDQVEHKNHEAALKIKHEGDARNETSLKSQHDAQEKLEDNFNGETVEFSEKGAIQTIDNLKAQIHHHYPDITKAPTSVQEFMKTDSTEEAIKLGFYNPDNTSGDESAMLLKGSTLSFNHGNISYHDIKTGQDHIVDNNHGYTGKLFDSDHSGGIKAESVSEIKGELNQDITSPTSPETGVTQDLTTSQVLHGTGVNQDLVNHQVSPEIGVSQNPVDNTLHSNAVNQNLVDKQTSPEIAKNDGANNNSTVHQSGEPQDQKAETPTGAVEQVNNTLINNSYHFPPEILEQIKNIYQTNVDKLFHDTNSLHAWNSIKNSTGDTSASHIMSWEENPSSPNYELVKMFHTIRDVTGLEPFKGDIFNSAETPDNFLQHGYLEGAKLERLNDLKFNNIKF